MPLYSFFPFTQVVLIISSIDNFISCIRSPSWVDNKITFFSLSLTMKVQVLHVLVDTMNLTLSLTMKFICPCPSKPPLGRYLWCCMWDIIARTPFIIVEPGLLLPVSGTLTQSHPTQLCGSWSSSFPLPWRMDSVPWLFLRIFQKCSYHYG